MFKWIIKKRESTVTFFLLALFAFVGMVNPAFLSASALDTITQNSILYISLAVGMTFVLLTGNIDVSVGGIMGLCGAIVATQVRDGSNPFFSIILVLLLGCIIGLVNGFGVGIVGIPSIIMTLGTMGILRGLVVVYTGGKWVENLPDYFKNASTVNFGMNLYLFITLSIVIGLQLYITYSKRGKFFAAVGDNYSGAFLVGIPVKSITVLSFVISGFFSALAGCVYASQIGFIMNSTGTGIEMTTIAACVLGGVSLTGGLGSIIGATLGATIMTTITSALVYLKVDASWNATISGSLLIIIVVSDVLINKYSEEKARRLRLAINAPMEKCSNEA